MDTVDDLIAKHEAILRVRFYTKKERGLKEAIAPAHGWWTVTLFAGDDTIGYDARLLMADLRIELGETYELPAMFLSPELVRERFEPGTDFRIWLGRDIGRGTFVRYRDAAGTDVADH
jgi:hypothetical protein